jgi:hypothetical protein
LTPEIHTVDASLQHVLSLEAQELFAEEARLELIVRRTEEELSGLRDIDAILRLSAVKLSLCLNLMKRRDVEQREQTIAEKALAALRLVESLLAENVSEDQRGLIQQDPRYAEVRALLEEFLLAGGSGFLEAPQTDARRRRVLSRSIVAAIRRHAAPDDRSPPLLLDDYPPVIRTVLKALFPVMVRENPEMPPYGIEEGEEVIHSSPNMKLPLSQAIFYMENELIPELQKKLEASPGSGTFQRELQQVRERVEDYKKLRFFPRSTPVLLEKGYYTDGMTSYTTDGEMLVPIPLAVSMRSGTNLDRKMELVRMDVVRRIAGRKVSDTLDREYRRLRSLESGRRGSSRTPSMKLDTAWGYRALRQEFPFLARLADKGTFQELVNIVQSGSAAASQRRIEALMEKDQQGLPPVSHTLIGDAAPPGGPPL